MKPVIVMQTDFTKGYSTCSMDGVILLVDPTLRSYDCTHDIAPFNIHEAALNLHYLVEFWPAGTVFVSVVDPGVGTDRRACVAKLKNGSFVVTPDNGSLTYMKKFFGIEAVRSIDETVNRYPTTREVSIFHGRDLFAYCAARLAAGVIDFAGVGPEYPVEEVVELPLVAPRREGAVISGMIELSDQHFGLVNSNMPYQMLEELGVHHGDKVLCTVTCEGAVKFSGEITYAPSFGFVPKGEPLVMISENKTLEIAKNQGNIARDYGLESGPAWIMSFQKV